MRWFGARRNRQKGQNLVEFALLAPVIFLLLFGIIDIGFALDHRLTLQHAVREGARFAAVHADCEAVQARTRERANDDELEVSVCYFKDETPVTSAAAGDTVKVTATYHYSFPLLGFTLPDFDVPGSARLEMAVPDTGECCP